MTRNHFIHLLMVDFVGARPSATPDQLIAYAVRCAATVEAEAPFDSEPESLMGEKLAQFLREQNL